MTMPFRRAIWSHMQGSVGMRASPGFVNGRRDESFPARAKARACWKLWPVVFGTTLLLFAAVLSRGAPGGQAAYMEGVEVSGTVSVGGNSPLPIILVRLQPDFGGIMRTTNTDTLGNFTFLNVAAGSYSIVVSVPGYQPVDWRLQVGTAPVVGLSIVLRPDSLRSSSGTAANGSGNVSVRQLLIPAKALDEYNKALESAARGKTDDAIKHWKKSIKIFPRYAESYMQLSKAYANRGDFAQAVEAANRAIEIDGKSADPYEYLGYVYLKERDFPKAKDAFAHAVRLSDSRWSSQFWLGKLLLNAKDAKGAYPHLLRASQLNPRVPDVEIALYDDLVMLGRLKDALAEIDDFLARFPNNPLAAKARAQRDRLAKSLGEKKH